jgi:hypothetical protein
MCVSEKKVLAVFFGGRMDEENEKRKDPNRGGKGREKRMGLWPS